MPTRSMDVQVNPNVQLLYDYIQQRGTILPINDYDEDLLRHGDVAQQVVDSIRLGTSEWEGLVPQAVKQQIKSLKLLGYSEERARQVHASKNGSNGAGSSSISNGVEPVALAVGKASSAA